LPAFATSFPRPGIAVIAFGENAIGGPDAVELTATIRDAAAHGATCVVLDLEQVAVMNSSGLGMLVSARSTTAALGVELCLAAVPTNVMNLLTMTQLSTVFVLHSTVDQAVAAR
jgi:anti-sigma B factor antagonist